jgi:hypothetical protein
MKPACDSVCRLARVEREKTRRSAERGIPDCTRSFHLVARAKPNFATKISLQETNQRLAKPGRAREVPRKKFRVEVICVHAAGAEQRCDAIEMERNQWAMGE